MSRFLLRVLVPAKIRRVVRARFDARYVVRADHRRDVRDALWEVRSLRREVVALRAEVERLRKQRGATPAPADPAKVGEARRLAEETAAAADHLLQSEVLIWQAVDRLEGRIERLEEAAEESRHAREMA
ncbi:hypothetical protein AB0K60_27565 [Thermopolyspora sp. NPDC052614]|uniref:hypothetical protein n=1 Tax=Thermopolyspora sp. NPDC052614 TaxID=3155682 RepID=UPI003426EBCF